MRTPLLAIVVSAGASAVSSGSFATPPAYLITDVSTLYGPDTRLDPGSVAAGLSRSAVVGHSITELWDHNFHAFRLVGTQLTDLGVLPGDEQSMAFAANAQGDTVGVSYTLGDLEVHGVLWPAAGGMVALGPIEPRDINSAGAIAGSIFVAGASGTRHASLLVRGASTDLGTLGGPSSMGLALNGSNWVVGDSMLADNRTTHGVLWRSGGMVDLGTLGGSGSRALDIDGLLVVGFADTVAARPHAVRWTLNSAGAIVAKTDLGTLPGATTSAALSISGNEIVGTSGDLAFRWSSGSMIDLNTTIDPASDWILTRATGIDSEGRIIGIGRHHGLTRGFVLTPRNPADFDGDGTVGAADLALLLGGWGSIDALLDLNADGIVGAQDLAILLGAWS